MGRTSLGAQSARSQVLASREAALAAAPKALQDRIKKLNVKLGDKMQETLDFYRVIGREMLEIKENKDNKFGDNPLDKVAEALQISHPTLRMSMLFVTQYTDEEYAELTKKNTSVGLGQRITWSHLVHLIGVSNKQARARLEEKVFVEEWDQGTLLSQIQKAHGGPRSSGGRPMSRPASLTGVLSQIKGKTQDWIDRDKRIWRDPDEDFIAQIINTPPDEYDPELLGELQSIQTALGELHEAAATDARDLARAIDRVAKIAGDNKVASARKAEASNGHTNGHANGKAPAKTPAKSSAKAMAAAAAARAKAKAKGGKQKSAK